MLKKTTFLISALCMLILANVLMMSYASPAFRPTAEGFVAAIAHKDLVKARPHSPQHRPIHGPRHTPLRGPRRSPRGPRRSPRGPRVMKKKEGFSNFSPGGAKGAYQPMGAFDGVKLPTGTKSSWRHTSPDEALRGNYPKFEVGPDNLFMFKDNQCKPSCCGASYACDGGCVCTTPEQRNFINMRGGNRTAPDAGV